MNKWYERNKGLPHPSQETRELLAKAGRVGTERVQQWFQRKRERDQAKHETNILDNLKKRIASRSRVCNCSTEACQTL